MLHLFDRGYAGGPWLELMWRYQLHFLIRWKKGHHFLDENGQEKSLGQIGKQHRSWGHRMIWDERKKHVCKTGIVAVRVRHTSYQGALWVVINRCIETEEQAWECYYAYCRRWQVETVFRFEKSELAIETIRVWKREKRNKFFHMVSLVHALLFHLLDDEYQELVHWILREYCHRTGKKQREAKVPIYRLRWALSRFWQEIRPVFSFPGNVQALMGGSRGLNIRSQNSG